MTKFTDSSYTLLEEYFDIVKTPAQNVQNSYLAGPTSGIWAEGGVVTTLYEKKDKEHFVAHKFRILSIEGDNDFIFKYEGLSNTNSLTESLSVGSQLYFRKDSYFHDWLIVNSALYKDYINVNVAFLYFGVVTAISGYADRYRVRFEGLKNYTKNALPVNNRTTNIIEWLEIFWDESYQPVWNKMKTLWTMIDAKEVDLDFLGYIAQDYGIEIDEEIDELRLREWVQNLIYYLKRKGTYSAYYAPWKLLLGNTINTLNIYERWQEWCSTTISNNPQAWFEDHHYLEYYGVQPSGAAGNIFYSRYNPDNYPTYATEAPTGACSRYYLATDSYINYSNLDEKDTFLKLTVAPSGVTAVDFDANFDESYLTGTLSSPIDGDFAHTVTVELSAVGGASSPVALWGLGNLHTSLTSAAAASADNHFLAIMYDNNPPGLSISETVSGSTWSTATTAALSAALPYKLVIERDVSVASAGALIMTVYTYNANRPDEIRPEDQLQRIHHNLHGGAIGDIKTYTKLMGFNYFETSAAGSWNGRAWDLGTSIVNTQTVASTGSMILSPHIRVEVDLSGQPLANTYIINEYTIDELVRYWGYIKPVYKFIKYGYLLSPLAKADTSSPVIPTYATTFDGYLNTVFTGSFFTSGSGVSGGILQSETENTNILVQTAETQTWKITHNLGASAVLIQAYDEDNELMKPQEFYIDNENTARLIFNEPARGIAYIKKPDKTIYQTTPSSAWTLVHSYGSSGVSATVSEFFDDTTKTAKVPSGVYEVDSNTLLARWGLDEFDVPELETGLGIIENADYYHEQTTASTTWTITHGLDVPGVLVAAYEGNSLFYPTTVDITSKNVVTLTFNSAVAGHAAIIGIPEDVGLEEGTGDPTGLNIYPRYGTKGYWELGDGVEPTFDYTTNNRLQNTIATGEFDSLVEIGNFYFLEFTVPEGGEIDTITEIGVFNNIGVLQFYSNCSPIYKPDGVELKIYYRIEKDGVVFT